MNTTFGNPPAGPAPSGMPATPPAQAQMNPAVTAGMLDARQQQAMTLIAQALSPQEMQILSQNMTPELGDILAKLFGPKVTYFLMPVMQLAQANADVETMATEANAQVGQMGNGMPEGMGGGCEQCGGECTGACMGGQNEDEPEEARRSPFQNVWAGA